MERQTQRSCPRCDAPVEEGQRFCSQCGSPVAPANDQQPTAYSHQNTITPDRLTPPPPPPPPPYYEPQRNAQVQVQQPAPVPVPAFAQVPRKRKRRGGGLIVILVLLLIIAGGGYYGYNRLFYSGTMTTTTTTTDQFGSNTGQSSQSNAQGQSETTTTTALNLKPVTYASVDVSVVNVQQAASFVDDTPYTAGVLRVNLQENNNSDKSSSYFYSDMMFLTQADGTTLKPIKSKLGYGPDAGINRQNWVDFALPTSTKPDQLTLVLGADTESQIKIPLKSDTDLTMYQSKTVTPGNKLQYAGTNWTITKASRQLSYEAKQAGKGQVFIVTTFTIDNPTQRTLFPFPNDTLRLQSGQTTTNPDSSYSFPSSVDPGQTNVTATCAFMMPANSTDFTLILRPSDSNGVTQQVTSNFQIPQ